MPMSLTKPPRGHPLGHRTVAQAAAEELRRRILDGRFEGGRQLRQDALAAEFGISRIPIREALLQLEGEGLVTILPHRGAVVAKLRMEEVQELFDLRAVLEPRLLRRSLSRLSPEDLSSLDGLLSSYSAELWAENARCWGELNTAFHMGLYRHAEQPRTMSIVATLLQDTDRFTRMQLALTEGRAQAEREHAAILDLCRACDVRGACMLLTTHIQEAGSALVSFVGTRKNPVPAPP